MRRPIIALAALTAGLALGSAAQAHARLLSTTPAVGAAVSGPPADIRMSFSEGVFPNFSGAVITDAAGHRAGTGASRVENGKTRLVIPLKSRLARGVYRVAWHVVCADTHRMQGQFTFSVK